MNRAPRSPAGGDRARFALLVVCLLGSFALYAALAVILGSVPAGWDGFVGFSLPSGAMFRSFTGLPSVALSPSGFEHAMVAVIVALWTVWAAALLVFHNLSSPESRRRAIQLVLVGGAAMLVLIVVCVPTVLSGDLYRQAAYGRMIAHHGHNPYANPVNAIPDDPLFALANHRHLTTHYGPAYTLLSALAAAIAPSTALGVALLWKAMSACAAVGCAALVGPVVRSLGGDEADGRKAQLWLAWNPLLLIESGVSAHIEPIMMAAALAGLLLWQRQQPVRGVVAFAVSTLTKWVTGLLVLFVVAREVQNAPRGRKLRSFLLLMGAAALTTAALYAPFAGGLNRQGGISELAMRGSATVGAGAESAVPQWALLAGYGALVIGATAFVARGDWQRLLAATTILMLIFVMFVNPWPFAWYYLSPMVLAATLRRSRLGFLLRALTAGLGGMTMLFYSHLVRLPG